MSDPMLPKPEEFVIHARYAHHRPTDSVVTLKYPNLPGNDFDALIKPGLPADYDRDEIKKMGAALVYRARRYWKCPICDHVVDREDPLQIEKAHDHCQLREHYGAECIAHHQEAKARELLVAKRLKPRAP